MFGNFNNFDLEDFSYGAQDSRSPSRRGVSVTAGILSAALGSVSCKDALFDERDGVGPTLDAVVVDRAWANPVLFQNGGAIGKRFKEGGCARLPVDDLSVRRS